MGTRDAGFGPADVGCSMAVPFTIRSSPLDLFRDQREALYDATAAERRIVRDIVKARRPLRAL